MTPEDIKNRFSYHPPSSPDVAHAHEEMRFLCWNLAEEFRVHLPEGREKSLAVTKLEEAMMWANAAIARNQ